MPRTTSFQALIDLFVGSTPDDPRIQARKVFGSASPPPRETAAEGGRAKRR